MTPDELRRMSMDYCIIYEKGLKPVKAEKFFYFKSNMIKEFNKLKLDHNDFDAGVRGEWRKFNPYKVGANLEEEEQESNLNVESLDDLFDDDETTNSNKTEEIKKEDTAESNNKFESDLNELLFDDEQEVDNTETENGEMLDIQKELEAKFDELFGSIDDENDDNE